MGSFEARGTENDSNSVFSRRKRWEHVLKINIPEKKQGIDMAVCLGWCYYGFASVSKRMKERLEMLWSVFDEIKPGSRTRIRSEFASLHSSIDMILLKRAMEVVFVATHIASNSKLEHADASVSLLLGAFETVAHHAEQIETNLLEIPNQTSNIISETMLTILKSSTKAVSRFNSMEGSLRVMTIVARNFRRLPDVVVPVLLIVRLVLTDTSRAKSQIFYRLTYAKEFNLRDLMMTLTFEMGSGFEEDVHHAVAKLMRFFVDVRVHVRDHIRVSGASSYERCVGILSVLAVSRPSHDIILHDALPKLVAAANTMDAMCVRPTLRIVEILLAPYVACSSSFAFFQASISLSILFPSLFSLSL